jgi:hypothetical protein
VLADCADASDCTGGVREIRYVDLPTTVDLHPASTLLHYLAMRGLLKLHVPDHCPACAAMGTVALETTIRAAETALRWCCRSCSHEWRVSAAEITAAERRIAITDRRRISRWSERRGR